MKAINATPKEVRKIFADSYVIPDFQRRYSWEREQCETLWDDITSFHDQIKDRDNEEKYFLGNIVVHPTDNGKYAVIDGQQRLTTLLLLIKALHTNAVPLKELQGFLFVQRKLKGGQTDMLRVQSEVIDSDADILKDIMLSTSPDEFSTMKENEKCKIVANYLFFQMKIRDWLQQHGNDEEAFEEFIGTIVERVVLLPIECGSEDDALIIFETINNRGMSLSDADIFKAKLYHIAPIDQQKEFITDWNSLNDPDRLFRILMHVLRATEGVTSKEIGLRPYFKSVLTPSADWSSIMLSLKKIDAASRFWSNENGWSKVKSFWGILNTYPNQYWNYPLFVFLHKYGEYKGNGGFSLAEEHREQLETLLEETVRYCFIKGIVHNAVNTVKDTIFRVCSGIAKGNKKGYLNEYRNNIAPDTAPDDREALATKLENNNFGRYQRGLILLSAYLNPLQNKISFAELLWDNKFDIEHILPQEWCHYDGWTAETHKKYINYLGNLLPLERVKNIKARNEYLRKKKEYYKSSIVQDALEILPVPDSGWTVEKMLEIHNEKISRLKIFFGCS